MQDMIRAKRAYDASSATRSARQQEADVFRRANGALRAAQMADPIARIRALADNRRLWSAVVDLVRDPENALPEPLRAAIASVGISVQRELDQDNPDIALLISINENIAAGLDGGK